MADRVDKNYFIELAKRNPADICRNALCSYDSEKKIYKIGLWTEEYEIDPENCTIKGVSNNFVPPHEYFPLFIIYYLLNARDIGVRGEWISEKDIPGGSAFFRGPHDIPTNHICSRFNNDIEEFKRKCEQLQGTAVDMGDAAYTFRITPRIPITVLYWMGDEDFPAESKILYDRSIAEHLSLDIIFALVIEICTRISGEEFF